VKQYIAFLRAVNIGGHIVKMDALRRVFESLGLTGVETFIASGNVIFQSQSKAIADLEASITHALLAAFGHDLTTFVRSSSDLAKIVDYEAFPKSEIEKAAAYNVAFLLDPADVTSRQKLASFESPIDQFTVHGREVYWLCAKRQSESTFSNAVLEKTLGVRSTLRGMSTLLKIVAKYGFS
jgi:uncharacterized protein (DUF1697 family)